MKEEQKIQRIRENAERQERLRRLNTGSKLCNIEHNHFICCLNLRDVQTRTFGCKNVTQKHTVHFLLTEPLWIFR